MQKQTEQIRTVESVLETALREVGAVPEEMVKPGDFGWSRAARTDKGVHAACQVVACKLSMGESKLLCEAEEGGGEGAAEPTHPTVDADDADPYVQQILHLYPEQSPEHARILSWMKRRELDFVSRLKAALPSDICVHGVQRVSKQFDARTQCDHRRYEYVIPADLLAPITWNMHDYPLLKAHPLHALMAADELVDLTGEHLELISQFKMDRKERYEGKSAPLAHSEEGYTLSAEDLERLQSLFDQFKGTHQFRNFTSRISRDDPALSRYMKDIRVDLEHEGKLAKVTLIGQSFLFNQIRKMVALVIEIFRGGAPHWAIKEALGKEKRFVHMAPSEGLLLERPSYNSYNNNRATPPTSNPINLGPQEADGLEGDMDGSIEAFKREVLYPIVEGSMETSAWRDWKEKIDTFPYVSENFATPEPPTPEQTTTESYSPPPHETTEPSPEQTTTELLTPLDDRVR